MQSWKIFSTMPESIYFLLYLVTFYQYLGYTSMNVRIMNEVDMEMGMALCL
jgi:hypothetical protein